MENKTLKSIIIVFVIIIIVAAGVFAYQHFSPKGTGIETAIQTPTQTPQATNITLQSTPTPQASTPPANQLAVFNNFKDNYGFQMQYPADASVMNPPTSKIVPCTGSCPSTLRVNNILSTMATETINGVNYCIYSGAKPESTSVYYNEYLYVTVKNNQCYGLDVSYSALNCNSYTTPSAIQTCQSNESKKGGLISQAINTIKFTK